jgi:hypothetical protein
MQGASGNFAALPRLRVVLWRSEGDFEMDNGICKEKKKGREWENQLEMAAKAGWRCFSLALQLLQLHNSTLTILGWRSSFRLPWQPRLRAIRLWRSF